LDKKEYIRSVMKTIKVTEVKNFRGGKLAVPEFDLNGDVLQEPLRDKDGKELLDSTGAVIMRPITTRPATTITCLDYLIMDFPRSLLTMKHITECSRLQTIICEAKEKHLDVINLEDAQYEWLIGVLKNDKIGVPMFGQNVTSLLNTIE
jgi:hypothetical protein